MTGVMHDVFQNTNLVHINVASTPHLFILSDIDNVLVFNGHPSKVNHGCSFSLTIVLSVLLLFTASDCPFGIF